MEVIKGKRLFQLAFPTDVQCDPGIPKRLRPKFDLVEKSPSCAAAKEDLLTGSFYLFLADNLETGVLMEKSQLHRTG